MNIQSHIEPGLEGLDEVRGLRPWFEGRSAHLILPFPADSEALRESLTDSPRVYKETVVVDDGVILVGVLTGEYYSPPPLCSSG